MPCLVLQSTPSSLPPSTVSSLSVPSEERRKWSKSLTPWFNKMEEPISLTSLWVDGLDSQFNSEAVSSFWPFSSSPKSCRTRLNGIKPNYHSLLPVLSACFKISSTSWDWLSISLAQWRVFRECRSTLKFRKSLQLYFLLTNYYLKSGQLKVPSPSREWIYDTERILSLFWRIFLSK